MMKKKLIVSIISIIVIIGISIYCITKYEKNNINSTAKTPLTNSSNTKISNTAPILGSIGVAKKEVNIYSSTNQEVPNDSLLSGQVVNITGENSIYYQIYLYGNTFNVLKSDITFYQNPYFTSDWKPCSLISSSNGSSQILINGATETVPTSSLTKITPGENAFATTISHMSKNWAFGTNLPIIQKALEITKNYSTPYEKAEALYVWEATHINYDFKSYEDEQIKTPTINELNLIFDSASTIGTFQSKQGICTGYSRLYAALCEAVGIPVKTVTSDTHEWNQINTGNGWFDVDVTWAAAAYYSQSIGTTYHTGAGGFNKSNTEVITNPNYNAKEHSTSPLCEETYAYFNNPQLFSGSALHPKASGIASQSK